MSHFHTKPAAAHVPCRCDACDAARYRWLRANHTNNRYPHITQYPPAPFDGDRYDAVQVHKHGLDAAIDAACIMAPVPDEDRP